MTYVIPGRRPVAEALRAGRGIVDVAVDARRADSVAELVDAASAAGATIRRVAADELDALAHGVAHQGIVARAADAPSVAMVDLAGAPLVVMLDGVTDPHNLGAIARTAEAAGAAALVLPRRRSAHASPAAEKTAAGALSWLPICVVPNLVRAMGQLADGGAWSVGLDADADATIWDSNLLDGSVVVVIGAEGRGLSRLVRERVDQRVSIPMRGRVASLNASAAAAIALGEVVRRRTADRGADPGEGDQPTTSASASPRSSAGRSRGTRRPSPRS